jgi:ankyrin repeat protein
LSADSSGDTLLHYAVNLDNEQMEKWLLEEVGIPKDVTNAEGLTPYD